MAQRRPKRRPPRGSRQGPGRTPPQAEQEPDLRDLIEEMLAEPHPLVFLEFASSFANLLVEDADRLRAETPIDPEGLLAILLEADDPAIGVLLLALHAYLPERVPASVSRVGRRAAPAWLARLGDARPTGAIVIDDVLGDAIDVAVEVELADGSTFSLIALVDHNMGTILKDAFALDVPLTEVVREWQEVAEPGSFVREISLADAAALIHEAEDAAQLMPEAPETETWPQLRPLLDWVVRLLPRGGTGWVYEAVSDRTINDLVRQICAEAAGSIGPDAEDIVETLLRFAAVPIPGDPLRWSPTAVDALFSVWLPEHGLSDRVWLEQVPEAVRAVVRFAHRRHDVPEARTLDTLEVLDAWSLGPKTKRPAGRRSALREVLASADLDLLTTPGRLQLALLEADAGGAEALDRLDTTPLPAESLDSTSVPTDIAPRLQAIGALATGVIERFFDDPELPTVTLRLLALVAATDPAPFRRKSNDGMLAAAVTWMAAKANDAFVDGRTVKQMTAAFRQTGSPAQRAKVLLDALGHTWDGAMSKDLGDPTLLTSRRRAAMIAERDRLRALTSE